jgi:hypothetical protein
MKLPKLPRDCCISILYGGSFTSFQTLLYVDEFSDVLTILFLLPTAFLLLAVTHLF